MSTSVSRGLIAELLRPYRASFAAQFAMLLAYRSAALAGVATQVWWGGLKIMVYSSFYASKADQVVPLQLADTISYTWIAQALLAMLPWIADPALVDDVRSGAVAHDRLRPVDTYALWYARSAGWLAMRVIPRALMLGVFALIALPLLGLSAWALKPPASAVAGLTFIVSLLLALALAAAVLMLINLMVVILLDERGIQAFVAPVVFVCSGSLLPLALYPEPLRAFLVLQPLAGLIDIPLRIYFGELGGWSALRGLGMQLAWALTLALSGRWLLDRALRHLSVQGG